MSSSKQSKKCGSFSIVFPSVCEGRAEGIKEKEKKGTRSCFVDVSWELFQVGLFFKTLCFSVCRSLKLSFSGIFLMLRFQFQFQFNFRDVAISWDHVAISISWYLVSISLSWYQVAISRLVEEEPNIHRSCKSTQPQNKETKDYVYLELILLMFPVSCRIMYLGTSLIKPFLDVAKLYGLSIMVCWLCNFIFV